MIRLEDVHLAFGDNTVLDGVSLEVPPACIYALIGPGAAGKSVLFKVVAGLLRPASGKVFVDDEELGPLNEIELARVRKKIGMLFQNYALFDMNVAENIAFPLRRLFDLSEEEIAERVAERLERVALPGTEHRIPQSMSGGQKKRIGVARATIARPPIVLYDEPTAGLDPVTSQKIYDLVQEEQRAQDTTVMVISSDVAGVLTIADRVGMLHEGRLIFDGTTDDAKASTDPAVRQFVHGLTEGPL
ncbi:MAG TPA: ATP-binding cassette domain-containing protein [Polyangiaceae bacterium LLY-WYZ-15_(1-7)]|nr:ABC transporter ATP-binding protein [Myxococcales bacterium]MAT23520.1 ABC transporter ATP-binding protein [Sandaracinus sp.]HJK95103.1 ATP-binding cassette domain-containing protein [Polyangiaceae bacterium LLY-WYZ-15_(1-7)]MBJ73778.1 ABC transporter ATP-binding protein [Sandaracinus sp.]HJL02618.1 ATP-binding cassette domain-containing protein [Polyangiaceae bacterium LLY-WYZ-15_(1-7)]